MDRLHAHQCDTCGARFACDGDLEFDFDGSGTICLLFHASSPHVSGYRQCEACAMREQDEPSNEVRI
jgi:hypothetical protein